MDEANYTLKGLEVDGYAEDHDIEEILEWALHKMKDFMKEGPDATFHEEQFYLQT